MVNKVFLDKIVFYHSNGQSNFIIPAKKTEPNRVYTMEIKFDEEGSPYHFCLEEKNDE